MAIGTVLDKLSSVLNPNGASQGTITREPDDDKQISFENKGIHGKRKRNNQGS
jgi:hypothetical protein